MNHHGETPLADWERELLGMKPLDPKQALRGKIMTSEKELDDLYLQIGLGTVEGNNVSSLIERARVVTARVEALDEALNLL